MWTPEDNLRKGSVSRNADFKNSKEENRAINQLKSFFLDLTRASKLEGPSSRPARPHTCPLCRGLDRSDDTSTSSPHLPRDSRWEHPLMLHKIRYTHHCKSTQLNSMPDVQLVLLIYSENNAQYNFQRDK